MRKGFSAVGGLVGIAKKRRILLLMATPFTQAKRRTRMRRIREAVLPFTWNNDNLPKTVREYREKYKGVSRILDDHPEILKLAHEDLKRLSSGGRKGREADFTSETILRALVVHAIEGLSLRETVVRIAESEFLQDFLRTRKKAVMDYSFLDRCFQAIQPATWKQLNAALAQAAMKSGAIDVSTTAKPSGCTCSSRGTPRAKTPAASGKSARPFGS